jgi:hypothetical protein
MLPNGLVARVMAAQSSPWHWGQAARHSDTNRASAPLKQTEGRLAASHWLVQRQIPLAPLPMSAVGRRVARPALWLVDDGAGG